MKTLLFVFCLNFIIAQNLFSQEIFLVDTSKANIQLNSRQTNLLNIINNRISSSKIALIKNKEVNELKKLKEIGVDIFDRGIFKFKYKNVNNVDENTTIWTGENDENSIILVFTGEDITGSILIKTEKYKIESLGNGIQVLIKFDETNLPPEHCENLETSFPDTLKSSEEKHELENNINRLDKVTTTTTISVLVAYTQSAANASGNIQGLIQLAVSEANQSYSNSDVSINMNLVHSTLVNYTESGNFDTDLNRFINPSDGYMDNIHSLRNQYSADVCVLIINDDAYCGAAPDINVDENLAFCAVYYQCATGYYSFAHEIGHLQGAHHDRNVNTNPYYQYGHGYCSPSPSAKWRTIMAYDWYGDCEGCIRINYWSNPYKTLSGLAMGTVTYENNARVLNERANDVANFRVPATTSGTLASNETWYWNTLTGNITVPSGVTLTLSSVATVNLSSYSIVTTGGTIIVENGATLTGLKARILTKVGSYVKALYSSIQSAINSVLAANTNNKVVIQSGTYNENVSISGKNNLTIQGSGDDYTSLTGALTFYGCNNLCMISLTCSQINAYYCNTSSFYCSVSGSLSQAGFGLYYCTNFNQQGGYINNCNIGLTVSGSSGWSQLANYSSNNTSILSSAGSNVQAAYNRFCESINYDFSVNSSGYIASFDCYFRNGQQRAYNGGGTINGPYTPHSCSMAKGSAETGEQEKFLPMKIQSDNPVEVEFSEVNTSYFILLKKIKEAKVDKEELKNDLDNIVKDFKMFIKKYPLSTLSKTALTTAANSLWLFDDNNSRKNFLDEILNDKELTSLKGGAENLMIDCFSIAKDFDGAISAADALINKYKNDNDLLCNGLLKKGLILSYEMKQPEKAAECFSIILQNYPDNPLAEFAKNGLEVLGKDAEQIKNETSAANSLEFSTSSFPNPFNPVTTINYALPIDEKVVIKVYDILGREIAELVNEEKPAGTYSVNFDASNLPSGIYFYSITAGNFNKVNKMILLR